MCLHPSSFCLEGPSLAGGSRKEGACPLTNGAIALITATFNPAYTRNANHHLPIQVCLSSSGRKP